MFKGNKKITTAEMEMTEMHALIERLFGELNARLDKFDQTIQEMKESLQEENMKGRGKTLTTTELSEPPKGLPLFCERGCTPRNKCSKHMHLLLLGDDTEDGLINKKIYMKISSIAVEKTCVQCLIVHIPGYHRTQPLNIFVCGGSTHNFIDESVAAKLGCDIFPIKTRPVHVNDGYVMATFRVCNNFKLLLQDTVYSVEELYLLPLRNCDMVLGDQWLRTLEDIKFDYKALTMEFYFQGKKRILHFNQD